MNNPLTTDIAQMMEELAAILPPESRAMFLAACQNLKRLPLPANRDLATVFLCAAWTITQRGGLKALPEITKRMEDVIRRTVENTLENSVRRTVKEAVSRLKRLPDASGFSHVPKEFVSAIRNGPTDALYLEIAARVKVACESELKLCLDRIQREESLRAMRSKVHRWAIGVLGVLLTATFVGSLGIARHVAETQGFASGEKNFAADVGFRQDAIALIQNKDVRMLLSDPKLQGIRRALLDEEVLPALLNPDFRQVLLAYASSKSAKEKRELMEGIKLAIKCHQLGVRLYLADPSDYRDVLPANGLAIAVGQALITTGSIAQSEDRSFTLIPFQTGPSPPE
jgi:hypothetical protein